MSNIQILFLVCVAIGLIFFYLYWITDKKIFWDISTIFFCLAVILSYLGGRK